MDRNNVLLSAAQPVRLIVSSHLSRNELGRWHARVRTRAHSINPVYDGSDQSRRFS